jgi:hypothetical protein
LAPNDQKIRFVNDKVTAAGWLNVRPEHGSIMGLPSFLKVGVYDEKPDRTYFTILEGANKGIKASVINSIGPPHLIENVVYSPAGKVRINLAKQSLWYGTSGPFFAFSGAWKSPKETFTAIPRGQYLLQIPDSPHESERYGKFTDFQTTWFRIMGNGLGPDSSRYLHTGELSDGCVTVRAFVLDPKAKTQPQNFGDWANVPDSVLGGFGVPFPPGPQPPIAAWNNIYKYLIRARGKDGFVGDLVVE